MTPLALAEARLAQAVTDREAAEQALLAILLALVPGLSRWPTDLALQSRALEIRLEHPACPQDLALAHTAFRRAARAESKARSAAHRARWAPAPAAPPAPRRRKAATRKPAVTERVVEERAAA